MVLHIVTWMMATECCLLLTGEDNQECICQYATFSGFAFDGQVNVKSQSELDIGGRETGLHYDYFFHEDEEEYYRSSEIK